VTRSERLEPVIRISAADEQEAARALARARTALAEQEAKLGELRGYLNGYLANLGGEAAAAVTPGRLHEYSRFLARLHEAIAGQQARVNDARRDCEQQRLAWLDCHTRVQALGKVADNARREEHRQADRREQHQLDDRNARRPRTDAEDA
jgi:flagellar FliJ protein